MLNFWKKNDFWGKNQGTGELTTSDRVKRYFSKLVESNSNHWQRYRMQIIISLIFLIIVAAVFLTIDLVTKTQLYQFARNVQNGNPSYGNQGAWEVFRPSYSVSYGWIGVRSILNTGVTVFGDSNVNIPAIQALSIIASIAFIVIVYFFPAKHWYEYVRVLGLGVLIAGTMGNAIDRFIFGGVRDMLYIPYRDNGTFNLADTFIMAGIVLIALYLIVYFLVDYFISKKKDQNKIIKTDDGIEIEIVDNVATKHDININENELLEDKKNDT